MLLADAAILLGLMLVFGGASAFFSAAETALFSLQPRQLAALRTARPELGARLDALFANPRRLLSMILLADTLANLPLCLLGLYFLHAYSTWHGEGGVTAGRAVPVWPTALALFVLVVVVCDLLPKLLAQRHPEGVARPAVRVLALLRPVLDPVCGALQAAGEWFADRLTPAQVRQPMKLTEAEFGALVEVGAAEGAIHGAESEMIQEIIKLGDKTAKDCMTPRVEVFAVVDDLTNADAIAQLRAERRRRVPIYGETTDDIVGVLDTRRFLETAARAERPEDVPHYTEAMDPPSYVSESMRALDLLRAFLTRRQGMAVIVDEYGGTEGVVTLADITEEIVGDALPSGEDDLYIEALDDDRLLVGGHARLDDISEHEGFEMHAEGLDTLNGLIFNRLGYLPKVGSVLKLPPDLRLTVRRVTRKTVDEVLIERVPADPPPADAGEGDREGSRDE